MTGATVKEVQFTGGSLFGSITIEANLCEAALGLVCRETPEFQLEWHGEEEVSPLKTTELLQEAIKQRK